MASSEAFGDRLATELASERLPPFRNVAADTRFVTGSRAIAKLELKALAFVFVYLDFAQIDP